jgi:hypothetical protein
MVFAMRRLIVVVVATIALATVSACGDDESSGSPSGTGFAKQADADCKAANAMLAPAAATSPATAQQYQTVDDTLQALLRKVDALVPSDAEQDSVYQLLDGYRAIDGAAQTAAQSLGSGTDPASVAATFASAVNAPRASIATAAQALDIPECADPPLPGS